MSIDGVPTDNDKRPTRPGNWATKALAGDPNADLGTFQDGLRVRLIATERSALSTCDLSENVALVVARNDKDAFDYLPAVDQDRIVGLMELVPFIHGAEPSGVVRDRMIPLSEENLIGADASILSFVRDADRQRCRLVVSRREISGLVSLSDLQRLPVRAALFAMVTHLEMTMAEAIRREANKIEKWVDRLTNERKCKIQKEINKAKSENAFVDTLLFTQFADKITILKKSPSFVWTKAEFKRDLGRIEDLRNDLAHANDYAATRSAAASVCETVRLMDRWIHQLSAWAPKHA